MCFEILSDEYIVHNVRQRIEWEYRQPDRVVRRVTIYDIPLAEIGLSMGKPDMSYEIAGSQVSPVGQMIENPVMHVSYYAHWDVRVDVLAACANLWRDDAQVYVVADWRALEGDPGLRESGMTDFRQQTCRALRYNQRAMHTGGFLTRLSRMYRMIVES